jgi:pSer/pThr/pTyr-binding forkhead associated (FHA) protein
VDPRLQSVHLPYPRRQEFRDAREDILQARGTQTLVQEGETPPACLDSPLRDAPIDSQANTASIELPFRFALVEGNNVFPLKVGLNTLGRSSENDVVLKEHYVSRRHCAIIVHVGSACEVFDMASRNGTFLNENTLKGPLRLRSGDRIRICDRSFIFIERAAPSDSFVHDTQCAS